MDRKYEFNADYAVHPGETLREKLDELNMKPKELAIRTGKPEKTISNILNGKSSITPEMAVQFEKVLKIPANFWLAKQSNYNEFLAREMEKERLENDLIWARKFPYTKLAKLGYVKSTRDPYKRAEELLSFFNISRSEAWFNIYINEKMPVFFKVSLKHAKDPYTISVILKIGEIEASKLEAGSFNKNKLKDVLNKLKKVMQDEDDDFLRKIQKICLTAGVKVVYSPYLSGTAMSGVVRWIDKNPVVQLTDRLKRYDIFWFSLFHELGHIILHGKKKNIFLEGVKDLNFYDKEEKEADEFASDFLLKKREYQQVLRTISRYDGSSSDILSIIENLAEKFGTHKDIIIGRILRENEKLYKKGFLQKSLKKIEFR